MTINVIIADQERIFADALVSRLSAEGDLEVVLAVQVKAPGPWLVEGRTAQVMVLDGDLPGEAANRLCAHLSGRGEPMRVIMLSASSDPERILHAVRSGAAAWLRKDESLGHLLDVIRGVAQGETWLPPSETGDVLRLLMRGAEQQRESERLLATLTPRERAVLDSMAEGAGPRETAEALQISANTVRTHLQNLMAKLGARSALEAIALTRENPDWPAPDALPAAGYPARPQRREPTCVRWGMRRWFRRH